MIIKRVKLSEAIKKKGKTREELLKNMSAKEIQRRANAGLDNPLLTDAQLEEFRVAEKKEKKMEKVKVKLSEIQNKVGRTNWAFLKKASNAKIIRTSNRH